MHVRRSWIGKRSFVFVFVVFDFFLFCSVLHLLVYKSKFTISATMRTSWADSADNSAIGSGNRNVSACPPRSAYVPPHLRNRTLQSEAPAAVSYSAAASLPVNDRVNHGGPIPYQGGGYFKADQGRQQGYGSGFQTGGGGGWNGRGVGRDRGRREENPFENDEAEDQSFGEQENTGINFEAYDDIPVETSGENVPPPVNTFAEIDLGEALNQNIQRCKYVKPTPVQRYAIPISLSGRDLMACAQTGSGKTAAFCFPIISGIMRGQQHSQRPRVARTAFPLALILSPTRELSCQVLF